MSRDRDGHPLTEAVLWLSLLLLLAMGIGAGLSASTVRGPFDPLLHAGGSMLLTLFFLTAAVWRPGRGEGWFPNGGLTVAAVVLLVGVGIEVAQTSWNLEVGSLDDIATDAAGIFVGWLAWWWLRRRATRPKDDTSDSVEP